MNRFAPFALLCLTLSCHAEEMSVADALELGKSFGSENQNDLENLATNQNADSVPGYQGSDVPETQYSDDPLAMEDAALLEVNQNEVGSFVNESIVARPQFTFDMETDPLLTHAATIQEDPDSVVGTIAAEYAGCQSSVISTPPTYREETCMEWQTTEVSSCDRILNVVVDQPLPSLYLARVEVGAYVTDRGVFEVNLVTGETLAQTGLSESGSVLQCIDVGFGEPWCPDFYSDVTQTLAFPEAADPCLGNNTITVTSSCSLWDPGNLIQAFGNNDMDWSAACYVSSQPSCANGWTTTLVVDDDGGDSWFRYGAVFTVQVEVQAPPVITDSWDDQCADLELRAQ